MTYSTIQKSLKPMSLSAGVSFYGGIKKINANSNLQRQSKRSASFLRVCLPKTQKKRKQNTNTFVFVCLFVSPFFFYQLPFAASE